MRHVPFGLRVWVALSVGLTIGAGLVGGIGRLAQPRTAVSSGSTTSHATGLTLERVQELSELTTLKVQVADVQETQIRGHTGSIKAVLIVRGEVTVGIDLSAARFAAIDEKDRSAVLLLPQPEVMSVRLDHEQTKLVGLWESGLWTIAPGGNDADAATVNRAYRDAEEVVTGAARDAAMAQRARERGERVLGAFAEAIGWQIKFQWGEGP